MENKGVIGYKVFYPDWTCIGGFQYEVGKVYEMDEKPKCCSRGFHFCRKLADCFNYYNFDPNNKVAKVIALGEIDEEDDDSKCCTNRIQIIEELSWEEVLKLVNAGEGNTGFGNSGNCNSGYKNSGYRNSGNKNSGDWNSGNYNSGHGNSGDYNSGHGNSGDFNKTDNSSGCFNTKEENIRLFNKPSEWTYDDWAFSDARKILYQIPESVNWILSDEMTDADLEELSEADLKCQKWWDELANKDKECIKSIPNFDAEIF